MTEESDFCYFSWEPSAIQGYINSKVQASLKRDIKSLESHGLCPPSQAVGYAWEREQLTEYYLTVTTLLKAYNDLGFALWYVATFTDLKRIPQDHLRIIAQHIPHLPKQGAETRSAATCIQLLRQDPTRLVNGIDQLYADDPEFGGYLREEREFKLSWYRKHCKPQGTDSSPNSGS